MLKWSVLLNYALFFHLVLLYVPSTYAQSPLPQSIVENVDTLIIGGKVLDGSGNPWMFKDIGIKGGKIVFLGQAEHSQVKAKRVIDAAGLYVSPGFIDMHSHADPQNPEASKMLPQLYQGITTVVLGVDGQGSNDLLKRYSDYSENGIGVNLLSYVGFNAARTEVMGMSDAPATKAQVERMKQYVEKGLQQGAFGISSGLFYRPASFASTQEVIDVVSIAKKFNSVYDTHDRDMGAVLNGIGYDASVAEAIEIGEQSGTAVVFSHFTPQGQHNYGRAKVGIELIEAARQRGVQVLAAQHPYTTTQSSLLAYSIPDWALAGGVELFFERLKDPKTKKSILDDSLQMLAIRGGAKQILFVDGNHELNGKTLEQVANTKGYSILDTIADIAKVQGDASVMNIDLYDMENIRLLAKQEWMMTSTDGGSEPVSNKTGHPRDFGSFSKKIRQFVMDEKLLTLPFVVRGMTSLPAQFLGLEKRGKIALGYYADINIFDPRQVKDKANYQDSQQYSEGIEYMLINGQLAIEKGSATNTLAGTPLLHQHASLQQFPSANEMLVKLKSAFGGEKKLAKIERFSFSLTTHLKYKKSKSNHTFYDFSKGIVTEQYEDKTMSVTPTTSSFVSSGLNRTLSKKESEKLLANMKLNFLYFLRDENLKLLGPLDIPEHREQSWWILQSSDSFSLPLGLDPVTGHIRKVLFDDAQYILESDYKTMGNGVNWPHKFQLYDRDNLLLEGEFKNTVINAEPVW